MEIFMRKIFVVQHYPWTSNCFRTIIVTFTATVAYLLISYEVRILTSLIHLNLTVTIQLTIEIISNGICGLNLKQKYMIVGLLWFHQYYYCLPLVSPAIAVSRWFVSKLVFYYLRHENICLRHENVRLEVKMWDSHPRCGIERYGNISYVAQFEPLICGVKVLHTCMCMRIMVRVFISF